MSWSVSHTQGVVHDKPLVHGGNRWGLLNNGGREGFGSGTTGGLYAREIKVTTLADSSSGPVGSLRAACSASGPKWITFQPDMTAPARTTWPVPYNSAPLSAWHAQRIWIESGLNMTTAGNATIDGRASLYGLAGRGFLVTESNVIIHNLVVDFSQWWCGEIQQNTAGLYNIWDADSAYSKGPQAIQRAGQAWGTTADETKMPGNWKGTWNSGTSYQAGLNFTTSAGTPPDGVVYNSIGYKCILATSGSTPPPSDSTHWAAAVGGAVNGSLYVNIKENLVGGVDVGLNDFWFDHNTFLGTAVGDGNPVKNLTTLWDFMDDGYNSCYFSGNATYSWNHFQDCNKSLIIGCGSTDTAAPITVHHNRFQRGAQRQPLGRRSNVHVYANWYDQPGVSASKGEVIACDNDVQMLYEGNLAESAIPQPHPFAFKRGGTNTHVVGQTHGNVALGQMTLAADVGTLSFSPSYSYALPDLSTSGAQQAFRDSITSGAGAL